MNVPTLSPEETVEMSEQIGDAASSPEMEYACDAAALENNEMVKFTNAAGETIAVCRVEDAFFAISDACTHGLASLSEGYLSDDHILECPFHGGAFDIRTGKPAAFPCVTPIKTYDVAIVDGKVFVSRR